MSGLFEVIMLICFGISWPISVYKSITSKSTKGKSVIFTVAIMIGYVAGIISKVLAGNITYVLLLYVINLTVVTIDFIIYFINRRNELKSTSTPVKKSTSSTMKKSAPVCR